MAVRAGAVAPRVCHTVSDLARLWLRLSDCSSCDVDSPGRDCDSDMVCNGGSSCAPWLCTSVSVLSVGRSASASCLQPVALRLWSVCGRAGFSRAVGARDSSPREVFARRMHALTRGQQQADGRRSAAATMPTLRPSPGLSATPLHTHQP